jgi:energy-coupling factor transporter transmembrane protein EcfT
MSYRKTAHFRLDSVASLLLLIVFVIGMFFVLRGIFIILSWIAPVLLIAAFILDRSVVINYVKWLGGLVKSNPLMGIGAILLSLVGYMAVFPYLFFKALFKKKIKDVQRKYEQEQQGELIDFEEIESKPNTEMLELPQMQKQEKRERRSEYDNLFD